MFQTTYRDSKYLLGRYQFLADPNEIAQVVEKIPKLTIHTVSQYNGNNPILTPIYGGSPVILYLTIHCELPVGLLYIPQSNEIAIVNLRFHEQFYKNNTVIYGELINKNATNYLCVETVRLRGDVENQKTVETITQFDQILYTSFKEDLDLEPLRIIIKPFYDNRKDITNKHSILFLNYNLDGSHYIETKTK